MTNSTGSPRYGWRVADENKPALLVGDADRERGIALLRDAVVDGRLTLEEFSDRVGAAQLARTEQDLDAQIADVPAQATPATLSTTLSHRVICSQLVRKGTWELSQRSEYRSIFSTIHLDLRHAKLHGDVVETRGLQPVRHGDADRARGHHGQRRRRRDVRQPGDRVAELAAGARIADAARPGQRARAAPCTYAAVKFRRRTKRSAASVEAMQ